MNVIAAPPGMMRGATEPSPQMPTGALVAFYKKGATPDFKNKYSAAIIISVHCIAFEL
jgi:hypothetical protein